MVIFFRKYLQRCLASCYMHESPGSSIPVIYGFLSFSLHILGTQSTIWHLSSVQFSSVNPSCPTLCNLMDCNTPGLPVQHQLLESTQTHVPWVSDAIQPFQPLSSPSPALNLSSLMAFSNESALLMRWPKHWSFSFGINLSNEHPGLISFRMDWLDLLAVKGTLKSLLQHQSSKASIVWRLAFFIVQLSHSYMTTGKITALTRQNFFGLCLLICCLGWS